jgi:hypothetical protein
MKLYSITIPKIIFYSSPNKYKHFFSPMLFIILYFSIIILIAIISTIALFYRTNGYYEENTLVIMLNQNEFWDCLSIDAYESETELFNKSLPVLNNKEAVCTVEQGILDRVVAPLNGIIERITGVTDISQHQQFFSEMRVVKPINWRYCNKLFYDLMEGCLINTKAGCAHRTLETLSIIPAGASEPIVREFLGRMKQDPSWFLLSTLLEYINPRISLLFNELQLRPEFISNVDECLTIRCENWLDRFDTLLSFDDSAIGVNLPSKTQEVLYNIECFNKLLRGDSTNKRICYIYNPALDCEGFGFPLERLAYLLNESFLEQVSSDAKTFILIHDGSRFTIETSIAPSEFVDKSINCAPVRETYLRIFIYDSTFSDYSVPNMISQILLILY